MAPRKKKTVDIETETIKIEEPVKKTVVKKKYAKVNHPAVNVRKTPSLLGEIVGLASEGDKYELISKDAEDGFYNILFDGNSAYIMSKFVTL